MATSKLLQKPSIIEIIGSTIRIAHPDISGYTKTRIISPFTAASTALYVADNNDFADNDWFIMGEVNDLKTEECDVNGAVTRGTSLTITNSTKFSHEIDCPTTKIYERGIKIYGAATDGGAGTLIASVDAITTPIADAVMIQWNKEYTEYTLKSTDTTYAYYFVKFTDGTTDSSASDYILAAGLGDDTVSGVVEKALDLVGETINAKITREFLLRECNNCQDAITHYVDEFNIPKDWSFEMGEDETSISLTENENRYDLSGLSFTLKYPKSNQGIQSIKIGSKPLVFIDIDQFDDDMQSAIKTYVKTAITADDTSIVLDDTYEFSESGIVYIGEDKISYTGNTKATGTLTGCTDVDNDHDVDDTVWQGINPSLPDKYTINPADGYVYLNAPVDTDYVGYKLKVKALKVLTRFSDFSDTITIPFYHLFQYYLSSKIEYRKGQLDIGDKWMNMFLGFLAKEAIRDSDVLMEEGTYKDVSINDN